MRSSGAGGSHVRRSACTKRSRAGDRSMRRAAVRAPASSPKNRRPRPRRRASARAGCASIRRCHNRDRRASHGSFGNARDEIMERLGALALEALVLRRIPARRLVGSCHVTPNGTASAKLRAAVAISCALAPSRLPYHAPRCPTPLALPLELAGFQKRHLRSLAQRLDPVVWVGDEGLSEGVLRALREALSAHELVKVRMRAPEDKRARPPSWPGHRRGAGRVDRPHRDPVPAPPRRAEARVADARWRWRRDAQRVARRR